MKKLNQTGSHPRFKSVVGTALILALALGFAACSPDPASAPTTSDTAPVPSATTPAPDGALAPAEYIDGELALDAVPEKYRQYYEGFEYFAKLFPDPYAGWTPPPAPWKFCLNDAFQGNDWRQQNLAELQREVGVLKAAGLASGDLVVTNADNEVTLQLSQFNNLVDEGCNVIISIPGSPTALCEAFTAAKNKGVLVITDEAPTYCPNSINVSWNSYWAKTQGIDAVIQAAGGKGNFVAIDGIAGAPTSIAGQAAVAAVMAKYPEAKLLGSVAGKWQPAVVKTEMTKFLATHPQQVDGVFDSGAGAVAAEQALEGAGRPLAKVHSCEGSRSFLAYWKEHPEIATLSTNQSPASAAYETMLIAAHKLSGHDLAVNTVFYPVPLMTAENFDDWYKPEYTLESSGTPTPPDGWAVEDSYFDGLFTSKIGKLAFTPDLPKAD
ncbi:MAG: substrate-binding domain-containing protein [Propionibacteriaceae bacterium]|nr:substrate-binding domain-containing protein [Propionibacteriaceae bacterium]